MSLAEERPPLSTTKRRTVAVAKAVCLMGGLLGPAYAAYLLPALAAPMLVGLTGLLVVVAWRSDRGTR